MGPCAIDAWYIGPAMKHYRCYRVWIWNTRSERVTDTLAWFPTPVIMPTLSSLDLALAAAKDLVRALQHPSAGSPLAPSTDSQTAARKQLADIFQDCTKCSPLLQANTDTPTDEVPENAAANQEVQCDPAGVQGLPTGVPQGSSHGGAVPRVQTEVQWDPAGAVPRVDPVNGPSMHPTTAPTPAPTIPTTPTTCTNEPASQKTSATPPRVVPNTPTAPTGNPPTAPSTAPALVPTYDSMAKGSTRRRRRPSVKKGKGKGTQVASSMQLAQALATVMPTPPTPDTAATTPPTTAAATECAIPHGYAHAVIDPNTGKSQNYQQLMQGPDADVWIQGCWLLLGIDPKENTGTDTMRFIGHDEVPTGKTPTYLSIVVDIRLQKEETLCVRFTCGGDKIVYAGNVSTPTADMSTIKIHLNSTISTKDAKYMTMDVVDFYLNNPLPTLEYMRIPVWAIPKIIMDNYNLWPLVHNGFVTCIIRKGMYGLPQAGRIAFDNLVMHLEPYGYTPAPHTPGLWRHKTRSTTFTLVVDDFG
jgi:hypothetical protein